MSMPLDARDAGYTRPARTAKPAKKHTYKVLFLMWVFLIACGVWGTKLYSDHLRSQIANQITLSTNARLEQMEKDYQAHIAGIETTVSSEMTKLQAKVDALTELMAFTKDSENSKTDNSNQLYTQLTELKKKLEELERNLEVLK